MDSVLGTIASLSLSSVCRTGWGQDQGWVETVGLSPSSCLVLSCLALPCLVLSCSGLCCIVLCCVRLLLCCVVLSCLSFCCDVLPCVVLCCLVLPVLSCLVLSRAVLSCLVSCCRVFLVCFFWFCLLLPSLILQSYLVFPSSSFLGMVERVYVDSLSLSLCATPTYINQSSHAAFFHALSLEVNIIPERERRVASSKCRPSSWLVLKSRKHLVQED